jgi:hypothetical protein
MANEEKKVAFDPNVFLATVNGGRSLSKYRTNQKVFSQGSSADAYYVKHDFVRGHEVVCDDAAMALPPNCFGAHYCTWVLISEIA